MLIGIGLLFDLGSANILLIPNGVGILGAHLLAVYVLGHLVQAVGNIIEIVYWRPWKGMPTAWPITRTERNRFPGAKDLSSKSVGVQVIHCGTFVVKTLRRVPHFRASETNESVLTFVSVWGDTHAKARCGRRVSP